MAAHRPPKRSGKGRRAEARRGLWEEPKRGQSPARSAAGSKGESRRGLMPRFPATGHPKHRPGRP